MVERMETHAADIASGFGHELEKFPGKGMEVGVADHDFSSTCTMGLPFGLHPLTAHHRTQSKYMLVRAGNGALPADRRMKLRIGLNLGDVIADGDSLYGDGVNIAARLQTLAEGGGICVSGSVHDNVRNQQDFRWEYLGEQALKNISQPVRAYRLFLEPLDPQVSRNVPEQSKFTEKPSIAVLPFENLSSDPEQEYFADGVTEDILTALSRIRWFFVIARHTVFAYKRRAVDVRAVAKELGVHYVLEGSLRKAAGRIRVKAQLSDGQTGKQLWAKRYDREDDEGWGSVRWRF